MNITRSHQIEVIFNSVKDLIVIISCAPPLPCGPVAQWIRHLTTDQGIPGSSPGRVVVFLLICS